MSRPVLFSDVNDTVSAFNVRLDGAPVVLKISMSGFRVETTEGTLLNSFSFPIVHSWGSDPASFALRYKEGEEYLTKRFETTEGSKIMGIIQHIVGVVLKTRKTPGSS
ncbi:hypothetical protein PAPYR_4893 [Paratrimastix pyriformis]|uniref:IRS-type PTB domain-containing protein n=1 Tax=Paratrimastix pyriformis TaxID=342808 RepID=A0ABQ8UIQ6_9EUKA|nr:hypothetical protein PAPYR_4893 [Paratrimastix pyriformis]